MIYPPSHRIRARVTAGLTHLKSVDGGTRYSSLSSSVALNWNAVKLEAGRAYLDSPAIVTVAWWGGAGYHAVVPRWFTDDQSKIVFLDPAWGEIFEQVNDGYYTDGYGKGTITDIYYF